MAGDTFGHTLQLTTFGESHGRALGAVLSGFPSGIAVDEDFIQGEMDRRSPGRDRFSTQRREPDRLQILSGVFEGVSTGTAIGMAIVNTDQRSRDYDEMKDAFRPSHADYVGISSKKVFIGAMMLSGMLGGMAGCIEVLGVHGYFLNNFATNLGSNGMLASVVRSC